MQNDNLRLNCKFLLLESFHKLPFVTPGVPPPKSWYWPQVSVRKDERRVHDRKTCELWRAWHQCQLGRSLMKSNPRIPPHTDKNCSTNHTRSIPVSAILAGRITCRFLFVLESDLVHFSSGWYFLRYRWGKRRCYLGTRPGRGREDPANHYLCHNHLRCGYAGFAGTLLVLLCLLLQGIVIVVLGFAFW